MASSNDPPGSQGIPKPMIFWILWFSILSGLMVIQFLAPGGMPTAENHGQASILFPAVGFGLAIISMAVRFVVIPKLASLETKLPAMIVGLAIAESIGVLGTLVVPPDEGASRLFMLTLALVCIVASAPVYVNSGKNKNPFVN